MSVFDHVNKIDNNDAAQVAQAQLTRNALRRLQVGFENCVVKIARAHEPARVHIHCRQRFGLVNDEITARFKVNPAPQRFRNIFINIEQVENWPLANVQVQFLHCSRHELGRKNFKFFKLFARVDANGLGALHHHITQYALQQVQVLVQHRSRRQADRSVLDTRPRLAQVGNVFGQRRVGSVFAIGSKNKSPTKVTRQCLQALTQVVALLGWYFLGDTNVVVLRQKNQQTPGNADLGRQPRALGAHRILEHLHQHGLAFKQLFFNRQWRSHRCRSVSLNMAAVDAAQQIRHMQKSRAVQPNINKSRLHARQHAGDLAKVDVANQPALQRAFYLQLLQCAVLHHGHPGFLRRPVNQDVLLHVLFIFLAFYAKVTQQQSRFKKGKPHDATVAAADMADMLRRPALYGVSARFPHGFAGAHISPDLRRSHGLKAHAGCAQCVKTPAPRLHGNGCQHAVCLT